ncbi:MAG TPA: hypothetical protein VFX07_02685 [Candidatus Udaeobacter sp.]|jgi:hypothetical protein|nr:hypothetical protein [Candidatus Udaeobacter sp.]
MVKAVGCHMKPLLWLAVFAIAAVAAYCTLEQITFVPGVPLRGYVQVFAFLFLLWCVAIIAVWFLVQLFRYVVRRSHTDT